MALRDLITSDASLLVNTSDFAQSVTYRAKSGVETAVDVVLFGETVEEDNQNGIDVIIRSQWMSWRSADLPMDSTGTVLIDEVEWAVGKDIPKDSGISSAMLKRYELHEQGRPNLRRK